MNLLREYISKEIKKLLKEEESPYGPEEIENLKRLIFSGQVDNIDLISTILKPYPKILKKLISDTLDECKKMILSLNRDKIDMAFDTLKGLDEAYINSFSLDWYLKKYFKGLYNIALKDGGDSDDIQVYMSEGEYVEGGNGRYIMINMFGISSPYYILYDVDQDKAYSIEMTANEIPIDVVFGLIALFNPNAGILPVYSNIYGYNIYKYKNKFFVRGKYNVYIIEGDELYSISKYSNDEFGSFERVDINNELPSVIKYILAKNSKKIIDHYNGYDVVIESKTKTVIALSFLKPEYSIYYDEEYSDGGSDYIIYLIKNKINIIRYNQFKKKYPELVGYIEKIKNL